MCTETDLNPDGCGVKNQIPLHLQGGVDQVGRRPCSLSGSAFLSKWEPQGLAGELGLVSPPRHQLLPRRILTHNIRPWFSLGCLESPPNECRAKQRAEQEKTAGSNVNSKWVSKSIGKVFKQKMIFLPVGWLVTDAPAIKSVALVGYWVASSWRAVKHSIKYILSPMLT